jgi:hypothetical protein
LTIPFSIERGTLPDAGTLILNGKRIVGVIVGDGEQHYEDAVWIVNQLNAAPDIPERFCLPAEPPAKPCSQCGFAVGHADECEQGIDTVLILEAKP